MSGAPTTARPRSLADPIEGAIPVLPFGALRPRSPRYQRLPVVDGFDWESCLADVPSGEWYVVVFRSIRRADAPDELLTEFDNHAYDEAFASGGLLLYFRGDLDAERGCLSLCVWTDRERARTALALPRHRAATTLVRQSYEWFHLERYRLAKLADGRVVAEVWHEAEPQRDVA